MRYCLDILGLKGWLVGFLFEAVGNAQIASFIKNPANKGKLMQSGLWRGTRHPNYFGVANQRWGMWLIALNINHGWLAIIRPLTITFLLLRVSGVPQLENKYSGRTEFEEYKKRTSVLFLLPPKTI